MIRSLITKAKALQMKDEALADYKTVVKKIEEAARKGYSGVYLKSHLISMEISQRLEKDGFETTSQVDGTEWVWWG